jgi:hypothetical protein
MKKKISLKTWTYIGKLNYADKWCRPLCTYQLIKQNETTYKRVQKVSLLSYLIMFVPIHILQFLWCLWDGGIKEFTILKRELGYDVLSKGSEAFIRAESIFED